MSRLHPTCQGFIRHVKASSDLSPIYIAFTFTFVRVLALSLEPGRQAFSPHKLKPRPISPSPSPSPSLNRNPDLYPVRTGAKAGAGAGARGVPGSEKAGSTASVLFVLVVHHYWHHYWYLKYQQCIIIVIIIALVLLVITSSAWVLIGHTRASRHANEMLVNPSASRKTSIAAQREPRRKTAMNKNHTHRTKYHSKNTKAYGRKAINVWSVRTPQAARARQAQEGGGVPSLPSYGFQINLKSDSFHNASLVKSVGL